MQRWRGVGSAPGGWGRSVVTIGVFDGVHRGHQATIGHTVKRAAELGVQSVVVTFDPHPSEVVRPGSHPAVLTGPERKAELIEALGVDVLCVIPFTSEFSRLSPETFVHDVLVEHLHAALVVVGENFRFGHRASGDVSLLQALGRTFGFGVEPAPLVNDEGTVFSSTYIRSQIDAGEVGAAGTALGRPHRLDGIVVRGDQRGRELGFPTANLAVSTPHAAVPADGIYAGWLTEHGNRRAAAISVGTNPTFAGVDRRIEAFVLDYSGDLYGERIALEFVQRLRGMIKYDALDPLIAQIQADVDETRRILTV
ncbi:bifunctional riboflavin kinase/FAD synthetase [Longispora sp. NPDC051575]|uniref:bifunctional riboflavin kinase/FAD synthetase n=1 Tax=Longispora sp. NPDC051575 TaxID=3154943 RepID=UPI0034407BBA